MMQYMCSLCVLTSYLPDLRTTQCSRDQVWKVGEAVPGAWTLRGHNWGRQPLHDLNIAVTRGWVKVVNPNTSGSMVPETRWGRHQCSVLPAPARSPAQHGMGLVNGALSSARITFHMITITEKAPTRAFTFKTL